MKEIMDIREVAKSLGCSEDVVQRLVRTEELPATMLSGRLLFSRSLVDEWLKKRITKDTKTRVRKSKRAKTDTRVTEDIGVGEPRPAGARPGSLEETELQKIVQTLEMTGWNKSRAARVLGIHLSTLYRKMTDYGIPLSKTRRSGASGKNRQE
jgi:excisionase family DNA binding protein